MIGVGYDYISPYLIKSEKIHNLKPTNVAACIAASE